MMKAYLMFIFISCTAAINCPKSIKGMPYFDINRYSGTWYRIRYSDNTLSPIGGRCASMTYSVNQNCTVSVVRKGISYDTGKLFIVKGLAENKNAKISLAFPSFNFKADCDWIIDTDYVSFALIWGWRNGKEKAWLTTREQYPDRKVLQKALTVFDNHGLRCNLLKIRDQLDCPKESRKSFAKSIFQHKH